MNTPATNTPKGPRIYYGWIIVCVSFLSMGFHNSARFSFTIFQVPLIDEFGWSRGALGGAFSLMLGCYALSGPLIGSIFDKKGPRAVMPWGSLLIGSGLIIGYFTSSLLHIYLLYGVFIGVGMSMSGFALHGALMPRWFQKKRGLATGIYLSGGGVGILVFFPLIERLIFYVGWRYTFLLFGVTILLIMVPLKLIFLRDGPDDVGQTMDGLPPDLTAPAPIPQPETKEQPNIREVFDEVRHDGRFWLLACIVFFLGLNNNTIMSQLQLFLVDSKYGTATAALLLGGIGLIRMAGSSCMGWLSDSIGRPRTQALSSFVSAMGLIILLTLPAAGGSILMGIIFVLVYGFGMGGMSACHSAMSADAFGGRNFGVIMGFLEICFGLGGVVGPPAAGFIFDAVGSYNVPFTIIIAGLLSMSFVCLVIYPKVAARNN
ncbi:MAG: MFS transporter [Nitrospinaceae bacterium]|nr:MFS transporter [Nitrospinaceae bacterium]MBT4093833.1 MFS transporter [Nitrospinaceae bacterium]MBT5369760.1 MFS transporter [Nitrospinaceae bacterium]MBT5948567.1 MFS transporter [Nitrospinaceae bacterium]MBT6395557.1 MFS transporter [Nitrospinaceae bacterium]